MAGHGQVQAETPALHSKSGLCSPAPGAQRCPLVPPQALKDLKTLGCRKAMKKFERYTLLVSGGLSVAEKPEQGGCPWGSSPGSEGGNPGLQACRGPPASPQGSPRLPPWACFPHLSQKGALDRQASENRTKFTVMSRNQVAQPGRDPVGVGTEPEVQPAWVLTRACARPAGIPPRGGEPEPARREAPGRRDVQGRLLLSQLRRGPKGPQLPQRPAPVRGGARWQGRGRRGPRRSSNGVGGAVGVG